MLIFIINTRSREGNEYWADKKESERESSAFFSAVHCLAQEERKGSKTRTTSKQTKRLNHQRQEQYRAECRMCNSRIISTRWLGCQPKVNCEQEEEGINPRILSAATVSFSQLMCTVSTFPSFSLALLLIRLLYSVYLGCRQQ